MKSTPSEMRLTLKMLSLFSVMAGKQHLKNAVKNYSPMVGCKSPEMLRNEFINETKYKENFFQR